MRKMNRILQVKFVIIIYNSVLSYGLIKISNGYNEQCKNEAYMIVIMGNDTSRTCFVCVELTECLQYDDNRKSGWTFVKLFLGPNTLLCCPQQMQKVMGQERGGFKKHLVKIFECWLLGTLSPANKYQKVTSKETVSYTPHKWGEYT